MVWQQLRRLVGWLRRNPIFIGGFIVLVLAAWYAVAFIPQRQVVFAYSGQTCASRLILFPGLQKISTSGSLAGHFNGEIKILGKTIASTRLCWTPEKAPRPGTYQQTVSPFGGPVAATRFAVSVGAAPTVSTTVLDQPIPLTKWVALKLSRPDATFNYVLTANNQQVVCAKDGRNVNCNVSVLGLEQGKSYQFAVIRTFGQQKLTVSQKEVAILKAVTVTASSISPNQLVYDKPTLIHITTDKPLAQIKVELKEGDKTIITQSKVVNDGADVTFPDLDRRQSFTLTMTAEGTDGSTLMQTFTLPFKTSGGPKVTGINIGTSGVALGTTAVIAFDQPLSDKQDIGALVTVSAGGAKVTRKNNQALVDLSDLAKCSKFTITVSKDVASQFDVSGDAAWQFSSRLICHSTETVGYSTKGRPIVSYTFGSGSTTILYTGTIHGDEVNAKALLDRWVNELEANADNIPAGRQVVVVPLVNPDGYAAGSRYNANGIDLNRNWATGDWQSNVTDVYDNPLPGGGGPAPMSEKETQVLAALTSRLRPRLTMSYHSQGQLVIANQAADSDSLARKYVSLSGYTNATGESSQTFDYSISGTYDDWIAEKLGLPSVLIELAYNHTDPQWSRNVDALWAMLRS